MTNIILHNQCYIALNPTTWCATAEILAPQIVIHNKKRSKREQQRDGVRLLLKSLLSNLNIIDTLDENKFPYRLANTGYYVCFSHSGELQSNYQVAVAISRSHAIGIDIETKEVAWSVAQRFYHIDEIATISILPVEQRAPVIKQLWQIKESMIKIKQYKLAHGLGINYVEVIPALVEGFYRQSISSSILIDHIEEYRIALLSKQQAIIVF